MTQLLRLIRLASMALLFGVVWMLSGSTAQAHPLTPNPDGIGGGIPTFRRTYLEGCNAGGPAFTTWVSPRDRGADTTLNVTYGTTSVPMQLNDAGVVCETANKAYRYANWVESVGPGVPGTFVGAINDFTFSNHKQPGNYGYTRGFFDYSPPGGFTESKTYNISITARSILANDDGTFKCVVNSAPADHLYDWYACPPETTNFPIFISVTSPVEGKLEGGGCDIGSFVSTDRGSITNSTQASVIGWAKDRDHDFTQVHVYIDTVDAAHFVGSYDANRYPRTLNGSDIWAAQGRTPYGTGVPDWHNWFVVPKADMDRFADAYPHTLRIFGIGKNAGGSNNGENPEIFRGDGSRITLGPCSPPTCTATTDPAPPEPGVPFNIILSYIYNPGAQGLPITPTGSVSFNGGPTSTYTFPSSRVGGSRTFTGYTQNLNGTFTITASVAQAGVFSASCNNNGVHVANRPYVKVYGNDVSVGGKFADAATPNSCSAGATVTDASIWAFDKKVSVGSEDYYGGASSQFGVAALGKVENFFSAGARNGGTEPKPAVGLSFGNMLNNAKVTNYGGDSGIQRCIPNYYAGSTQPGADVRPGGTTITSADAPSPNQQKAIFVNGDAYISGNLDYPGIGNWANISQIPSLYIIAKGNIYIDNDVSRLDGVFVAQPDNSGNKGIIYTCTNGSSLYSASQLYDNCRNTQLTVTGSFIAHQVKYLRTKGTVGLSIPNGPPANPQIEFAWSSNGPISGQYCTRIQEIADPNTWDDNYICNETDVGLRFNSAGPLAGMTCINMPQPPSYTYAWTWADNYLCWTPAANLGLTWSITGPTPGRYCLPKIEEVGGWHPQTYLCEPIKTNPPYTAVNEQASSANIAEVFNFSQELYLAPAPTVLQTIIGPSNTPGKTRYESITSLPPIL